MGDHGFILILIDIARQKGVSAYVGEGRNAWPAVHVYDAARAFCLVLERGQRNETYQALAEQGIPFRQIAEAIAIGLGIPCVSLTADEARDHFDWFFGFAGIDQTTSSDRMRAQLGWTPSRPDLLSSFMATGYF